MADKNTKLSIRLTVTDDKATAGVRSFMSRIKAAMAPMREALAPLRGVGGKLVGIFKTVGGALGDVLGKIPLIGTVLAGTIGGAVVLLKGFIDHFDELGDKSEAIGVTADFLAQMRFAAKKSGVEVEQLDSGLQNFTKNLGQARAGTGRMTAFLNRVSPALLKQLKAAKSNSAAFDLLAQATSKLQDPAKRAALAQAALGDATLAPLLARGAGGIQALRDRYAELAGPQGDAVAAASDFDDAMTDLDASVTGIKAALVVGLAPALRIVVDRLRDWFVGNRENIAKWAKSFGEKLPGAIAKVVDVLSSALDKVKAFFAEMSAIIDAADTFLNGPKEMKGATIDDFVQGEKGLAKVRLRNQLEGTENMTPAQKRARAQQLRTQAAEMMTRDHSQREEDLADAMRQAAQILVDQSGGARFGSRVNAGDIDLAGLARAAVAASKPQEAKVKIDVNGPKGTRTTIDPTSTADVDVTTGNQLAPGVP